MDDPLAASALLPDVTLDETGRVSPLILAVDETVEAQRGLEQQLRSEFGVNNTDFRALLLISRYQRRHRPVHPGDLVRELGTSSGAAAQITRRLGDAGLLQRAADPDDARSSVLTLTPRAAARLDEATRGLRSTLDAIIADLADGEEQRLLHLLGRVRDAFDDHNRIRRDLGSGGARS